MAYIVSLRKATLWLTITITVAVCSWTFFTGWGVSAAYVGSHAGVLPESEISQASARAGRFFAGLLGAQCLLIWCAAKFVTAVRGSCAGVLPSFTSFALGVVLAIAVDFAIFGILILLQLSGGK